MAQQGKNHSNLADSTHGAVLFWNKYQNHLQCFLKSLFLGPTPRMGLGRGLRICIFIKFPGNLDAAGPGTPL